MVIEENYQKNPDEATNWHPLAVDGAAYRLGPYGMEYWDVTALAWNDTWSSITRLTPEAYVSSVVAVGLGARLTWAETWMDPCTVEEYTNV